MSWFDEQIKQRKISDSKALDDAFYRIADSVTGKNIAKSMADSHEKALGAIGEIIRFYGGKMVDPGTSFTDINDELEYICRPNGIMHRRVNLDKGWYKDAFGVYLTVDNRTGNITALIPDRRSGKYKYYDEEAQMTKKVSRKNAAFFDEDAICFYQPLPLRKLSGVDLIKFGISQWAVRDIVLPVIMMVLVTAFGFIMPQLSHYIFSDVYKSQKTTLLLSTAFFMCCVSVSGILLRMIHKLATDNNKTKTSASIESAMMMRTLTLPANFFKNYSSGEISQRISYANTVCATLADLAFDTGITSVLSFAYIYQIVLYAKPLLVPSLLVLLATLLFSVIITLLQIGRNRRIMEAESSEAGLSYSTVAGIQKIKLAGAETRAFSRWGKKYAETSDLTFNLPLILKISSVIVMAISLVGNIFIYASSVKNGISVADFLAYETAFAMVSSAFMMLAGITDSIAGIKPSLDLLRPFLDIEPEISEGKQLVARLNGNIELNNVSFKYEENMPWVVDNLSLKIHSGQYVAIVGKTGCGKSTLMRLLLGFEKPMRGAIYYDGKDMNNLDLRSLRRHIGTVMQNGKLFQGDIFSNITISAPWLTLDDAWEAARMAGMDEDIRRMPMGMQSIISEGAGGISGGQRQRLMIARAVAPKPKILIFDEATSALDNITQKIVSDSLDALKCTRIIIAHRLSTIRHCDRIIFLDGGKIVEDGTYDELIENNGPFAELVRRQQLESGD